MTNYTVSSRQNAEIRERIAATLRRHGIDPAFVEDHWSLEANSTEGATLHLQGRLPLTLVEASEIVNGPPRSSNSD